MHQPARKWTGPTLQLRDPHGTTILTKTNYLTTTGISFQATTVSAKAQMPDVQCILSHIKTRGNPTNVVRV